MAGISDWEFPFQKAMLEQLSRISVNGNFQFPIARLEQSWLEQRQLEFPDPKDQSAARIASVGISYAGPASRTSWGFPTPSQEVYIKARATRGSQSTFLTRS